MITIEEIKGFLNSIEYEAFEIFEVGAYSINNKIVPYVVYRGHGLNAPATVLERKYDSIVYFTDEYIAFLAGERTLDETAIIVSEKIEAHLIIN